MQLGEPESGRCVGGGTDMASHSSSDGILVHVTQLCHIRAYLGHWQLKSGGWMDE